MAHKHCFEALDRTLRDIVRSSDVGNANLPFGGKVVVLGGDFRQILPVIPKGTRHEVVRASINSSYLWNFCKVLTLTTNMRLLSRDPGTDVQERKQFSYWILGIRDGTIGDIDRAILAPINDTADKINDYILSLLPSEEKTYLSFDTPYSTNVDANRPDFLHTPEFLNTIVASGLPNNMLKLKVGVPIMLLRNIDQSSRLCNGTRMLITKMGKYVVEGRVISGSNIGQRVYIPRLSLTPSDKRIPFKFQRRQFPLALSSAMTINKSQGQSLKHVGVYLPQALFSHGQLHVAISRITSKEGLKILITDGDSENTNITSNVVYKEVFQNL